MPTVGNGVISLYAFTCGEPEGEFGRVMEGGARSCSPRTLHERRLPRYVFDREAMIESLNRLQALETAGARIFFGHDPEF